MAHKTQVTPPASESMLFSKNPLNLAAPQMGHHLRAPTHEASLIQHVEVITIKSEMHRQSLGDEGRQILVVPTPLFLRDTLQ